MTRKQIADCIAMTNHHKEVHVLLTGERELIGSAMRIADDLDGSAILVILEVEGWWAYVQADAVLGFRVRKEV